jgi:acetyl-CoA carboxylase carboxyl transferase subunit beta
MRNLFRRALPLVSGEAAQEAAPDLWVRCGRCREMLYAREWEAAHRVCTKCGYHARLTVTDRVTLLLDEGSWQELGANLRATDPLGFAPPGRPSYAEKLVAERRESGQNEAAAYGRGTLDGIPVALAVLDMGYFAGTLGAVVGEKVARAFELGVAERRAVIVVSASGGARQQEGVVALLQMAKLAAAAQALASARMPFISILTDPTLGGVTASFATLGDCIIAEPGAVIGFAGPRIIEQTTGEKLPPGAQTAEFQLTHGMVDLVIARRDQRSAIARVIRLLLGGTAPGTHAATHDAFDTVENGVVSPLPLPAMQNLR